MEAILRMPQSYIKDETDKSVHISPSWTFGKPIFLPKNQVLTRKYYTRDGAKWVEFRFNDWVRTKNIYAFERLSARDDVQLIY
jgi:hypothetical protein